VAVAALKELPELRELLIPDLFFVVRCLHIIRHRFLGKHYV
jgi:hypothetical protein